MWGRLLSLGFSKCCPAPLRGLDDRPSSGRAQRPLLSRARTWRRCSSLLSGCGPSLPLSGCDSGPSSGRHPASHWSGCAAVGGARVQHLAKLGNLGVESFLLFFETSDRSSDDFGFEFCRHASLSMIEFCLPQGCPFVLSETTGRRGNNAISVECCS